MSGPITAQDDGKDWTWVLTRPCPECGFDANSVARDRIGSTARAAMQAFANRITEADATVRPSPDRWSPLEYACHVRDVCAKYAERVALMLDEDDPMFANWDQDATAREHRYWTQSPAVVAEECAAAGQSIAAAFDAVTLSQWERPGQRSDGSMFTVESLGRYMLHDLVHHLHDVGTPVPG